jgi:uncharacterized membrane protein
MAQKLHTTTVEDLAERNVETIARMERLAQHERNWPERIADQIAIFCGSWLFLLVHAAWFAVWILRPVEPFPFGLLTMIVSLEAIFLSTIIMISQNRQSKLSERRNHLDLQIDLLAEQENTEMLRLMHKICTKLDIPVRDANEAALEQETKPETIVKKIEQRIEEYRNKKTHSK